MRFRNEIWLADLDPQIGTEAGKLRPVVIIQTNILNEVSHSSTLICPVTTKLQQSTILRVRLFPAENGINKVSDILVDQIRAIDNSRFKKKLGNLTVAQITQLNRNLKIVLELS